MNFSKEITWDFDQNKKIGHKRIQLGENGLIADQWIADTQMGGKVDKYNLNTDEITQTINSITEHIKNYDRLVDDFCDGQEGLQHEQKFFFQKDHVNYWIRTLPIGTKEYNLYVNVYHI